jgi:K+-transporting ATPase ATPase A chain
MTMNGWIQIAIYCAIVVALVKPLGWYMTRVFNGSARSCRRFCGR